MIAAGNDNGLEMDCKTVTNGDMDAGNQPALPAKK